MLATSVNQLFLFRRTKFAKLSFCLHTQDACLQARCGSQAVRMERSGLRIYKLLPNVTWNYILKTPNLRL